MTEKLDCELDIQTRALAELLAQRLDATQGTARVTLVFRDGVYVDGYLAGQPERLKPTDLECRCRRHAWHPDCPIHLPASTSLAERREGWISTRSSRANAT